MRYPLKVVIAKDAKGVGGWVEDYNHGVHEGVVTLINKIRSKHPELDPDHQFHLYPQIKDGNMGSKPARKALPEDDITFLEDCGVDQTDYLFYQP